ncbi:hypothetical protein [Kocuria sp. NPDC057446]|uniref:hypothetical protein n=1 Tax=Kocuria sp. NPDC057446 TaxID=3346137 RepID=UPI0036AC9BA6
MDDPNGEKTFFALEGNCPVVVVAPHAGRNDITPSGARAFGKRENDPSTARTPNVSNDVRTLEIAFALVRTLSAMGFVPYAFLNCVSRGYMDLNRPWGGQEMWRDANGVYRPGDELKSPAEFPRVRSFAAFKRDYYDRMHAEIQAVTTDLHPNGWIFDVHGRQVDGADLELFTGYGHYARRDFIYDNGAASLHAHLVEQGWAVRPGSPDPGDEVGATTSPATNLISGGRYGASHFSPTRDPIPRPDNVIPTAPHRLHGVQFEISRRLRPSGPPETLENVGIGLAHAMFGFLRDNGVITRVPRPLTGHNTNLWM